MKTLILALLIGMLALPVAMAQEKAKEVEKKAASCCAGGTETASKEASEAGCADEAKADGCADEAKEGQTMHKASDETKEAKFEAAKLVDGVQEIAVSVKDGYHPSAIRVKKGVPVRMNFKLEEKSCTGTVVFKDMKIKQKLEFGKTVPVEFTPDKEGTYVFACPMDMTTGTLIVSNE